MTFTKKKLILASLCALSISGVANAAQIGSYVGVAGTISNIHNSNVTKYDGADSFKDNGLAGLQLSYGYNKTKNFGYELSAGYIAGRNKNVKLLGNSVKTKMNGYVLNADVVGYLPINNTFELYAKGGLSYGKVKLKADYNINSNAGTAEQKSSDFGYNVGAGVMANITQSVSVKTGYDYTRFGKNKIGQFVIGINYQF